MLPTRTKYTVTWLTPANATRMAVRNKCGEFLNWRACQPMRQRRDFERYSTAAAWATQNRNLDCDGLPRIEHQVYIDADQEWDLIESFELIDDFWVQVRA